MGRLGIVINVYLYELFLLSGVIGRDDRGHHLGFYRFRLNNWRFRYLCRWRKLRSLIDIRIGEAQLEVEILYRAVIECGPPALRQAVTTHCGQWLTKVKVQRRVIEDIGIAAYSVIGEGQHKRY